MYEMMESMYTCLGKNNNGLVYWKLINTTILYLLTKLLYFYVYSTVDIYGRYSIVYVFDPPTQNTIMFVNYLRSYHRMEMCSFGLCFNNIWCDSNNVSTHMQY